MAERKELRSEIVELNNGCKMPLVGLGTFQGNYSYTSTYDMVVAAVRSAVDVGYRHFDTATIYDTEKGVGAALNQKMSEGAIKREDIFVTTKIWCTSHRKELVVPALQNSLSIMGLDYVDMYLIHWPMAMVPSDDIFPKNEKGEILYEDDRTSLVETWQGMEECVKAGLAKSIGISNFNLRQIQYVLSDCTIKPANIQIEVHPFFSNAELADFCKDHGIVVSGYSPLGKPSRSWAKEEDPSVFTDPTLIEIAAKYNKTAPQVVLRFQTQRSIAVVPKSNTPERQRDNLDIFDFSLTKEDMERILKLNQNFRILALPHLNGSKEYPFASA